MGATGDLERFQTNLQRCKDEIEKSGLDTALVVHHDEADGLTSAALTKLALEHAGFQTQLVCLDKLYPEVVAQIQTGPKRVIAYADLGSAHIDWLAQYNKAENLILSLDHHDTVESSDPRVMNLNPELVGFSGEKEASSATVAYMFATAVDPELSRYGQLALIGSLEIPGEAVGLNAVVERDVKSHGPKRTTGKKGSKTSFGDAHVSTTRAASILNVLGSVGYYRNGPERGVRACIDGFDNETLEFARRLEEERKEANRRMLSQIRQNGLSQGRLIQSFHARDNYSGMSGKVVGSFCSYLRYQRGVNPVKYLIGMMNVPPDIPGWGKLPAPMVKVSARAPQLLTGMIEKGVRPALSRILPGACAAAGGFGDGHSVAASGVFLLGGEGKFLESIDSLAGQ